MNVFRDQEKFMKACDQSITGDQAQFDMYCALIEEEHKELKQALADNNHVETLDALIDILVVTIGAIHSAGWDAEGMKLIFQGKVLDNDKDLASCEQQPASLPPRRLA